jgi:hypothetical protein
VDALRGIHPLPISKWSLVTSKKPTVSQTAKTLLRIVSGARRAESRHGRHRMFMIVDRSQLTLSGEAAFVLYSGTAVSAHAPATVAEPN